MKRVLSYSVREVAPYINWTYFFHAWGMESRFATVADVHDCLACQSQWTNSFNKEERAKAHEALNLYQNALEQLRLMGHQKLLKATFRIVSANSIDDDIIAEGIRIPCLRQQHPNKEGYTLCLSDFIRPYSSGILDTIGLFATSIDKNIYALYPEDPYRQLLVETLASRLTEAATEKMHLEVRTNYWGYAPNERLSIAELHNERFQGIRPAVGYPSLPDQSINFILDDLLDMKQIGITLTENGMMQPHASVSGLIFAHPASRYFSVGKIDKDQLEDYARRRNLPIKTMRKYLSANLLSED